MRQDQAETALLHLERLLRQPVIPADHWIAYIDALIRCEEKREARAVLETCRDLGLWSDTFTVLQVRAQTPSPERVRHYLNLKAEKRRHVDAEILLHLLRQEYSDHPDVMALVGEKPEVDVKLVAARQTVLEHPENPEAQLQLGRQLILSGKLAEAESLIRQCIDRFPTQLDICQLLQSFLEGMGEIEAAAEITQTLILPRLKKLSARELIEIAKQRKMREAG